MGLEEPGLEDGVRGEQGGVLHQVQYPADALLAEAAYQLVKFCLLAGDTVCAEPGLRKAEPAGWLVAQEGWQLDVTEAGRSVELN